MQRLYILKYARRLHTKNEIFEIILLALNWLLFFPFSKQWIKTSFVNKENAHTHTRTRIYICTYKHIILSLSVSASTCILLSLSIYIYFHLYTYIFLNTPVSLFIFISLLIPIFNFICRSLSLYLLGYASALYISRYI